MINPGLVIRQTENRLRAKTANFSAAEYFLSKGSAYLLYHLQKVMEWLLTFPGLNNAILSFRK